MLHDAMGLRSLWLKAMLLSRKPAKPDLDSTIVAAEEFVFVFGAKMPWKRAMVWQCATWQRAVVYWLRMPTMNPKPRYAGRSFLGMFAIALSMLK